MKTKDEVLAAYDAVVTHPEAEANPYLEGMEAALSWVLTDTMRDILDGFIESDTDYTGEMEESDDSD